MTIIAIPYIIDVLSFYKTLKDHWPARNNWTCKACNMFAAALWPISLSAFIIYISWIFIKKD